MTSIEIVGVIDQDIQNITLLFQGEPMVPSEIVFTEIIEELGISQGPFVVWDIGTVEKRAQGFAECSFRDSIFLEQQAFQVGRSLQGFLDGLHEVRLADEALLDQGIVGTWFDSSMGCLLHCSYFVRSRSLTDIGLAPRLTTHGRLFLARYDAVPALSRRIGLRVPRPPAEHWSAPLCLA